MAALISVLVAVTLSLLITRIAAEALTLTGMSRASASFQARSAVLVRVPLRLTPTRGRTAFTGSGFTTNESESVVEHPVRRRIIMLMMFLGNAGIITIISSLVLTFVSASSTGNGTFRLLSLLLGIALLWIIASNYAFNRLLTRVVRKALHRWTDLNLHDYDKLLHLRDEYQVIKVKVDDYDDWLADKTFKELRLRDEGISVLGVERCDRSYIGVPDGDTFVCAGDTLIAYGRKTTLLELDARHNGFTGEKAHQKAVKKHREVKFEQGQRDR